MLLRRDTLDGIARGEIDVAFRWWTKPTVKAGGTLQTQIGQLAIRSVERTALSAVTVEDAKRAGFPSRSALVKAFPRKPGSRLYRVELALQGPDPRVLPAKTRKARALRGCRRRDSNPRHADYDSAALTD